MKNQLLATTLLVGCLSVVPALAQTVTTSPTSTSTAGAFDKLSPGNQKIARDLFNSQTVTSTSGAPMSLDQIAAAKGQSGWGEVFHQMKADGLVQAKNLGEVVSGRSAPTTITSGRATITASSTGAAAGSSSRSGPSTTSGKPTMITNGSGRTVSYGNSGKGSYGMTSSGSGGVVTAGGGASTSTSGGLVTASSHGSGGGVSSTSHGSSGSSHGR